MKSSHIPAAEAGAEVDEITLDGKRIRVHNTDLPLERVSLDPANPRIANTVELLPHASESKLQKRIEEVLWEDQDVKDLYRQVLVNKGLIERIIVRRDGRVVEGNCRTVVYRKLHEKQPAEANWKNIPARILPEDIAERDVAILLGEMHVAGKNTWSAFEKAGHIHRMHRDFALTQDEIAQRLRMSKSKVNQLIKSFDAMKNKYMVRYAAAPNVRKFSHFEELYKSPKLREWLADDPGAEDMFVGWVGEGKLPQGANVRELAAIVSSPEALAAMNERGFAEAKKVVGQDDPATTSRLFRMMKEMTSELEQARLDDIQKIRKDTNPAARLIAEDLRKTLGHFLELCGLDDN